MRTLQLATRPELLSPAGDWDALRAACANGADAVYFGLSAFNARYRASNFTLEELPKVVDFLHARNVLGFVTINTLIFSDELPEAARFVRAIAEAGVDAVIVQDFGLATLLREMAPDLHVHASTQMTLTEPRGVAFAKDRLNIRRAVLARELSVADIRKVAENCDVPLEVFVHGALCVAYSGQCLTSEALGGRSANRGQCAQACRLPYDMIVDGQKRDLGDKAYLLSPQDLAGHDFIDQLIDSGVISFKIEGRLKSSHYVAAATKTYRDSIDASLAHRPFELSKEQSQDLQQTFSRGFTPGFLEGPHHQRLVRGRVPKSRGINVGIVVGQNRRRIRLELNGPDCDLKAGDGIVFDLGRPDQKEPGGRIWSVVTEPSSYGKRRLTIEFENELAEILPTGTTVWKTDDPAMRKRLEKTYTTDPIIHRLPIQFTLSGELGGALTLHGRDPEGNEATAHWVGPLEEARSKPLSMEMLREQLSRLGDTPFELGALDCQLPSQAMVPKSVVNDLRRQVGQRLLQARASSRRSAADITVLDRARQRIADEPQLTPSATVDLTVMVRSLEQLEAVLPQRPTMVYCEFEDVRRYREAVVKAKEANVPIGLATLRILKPGEEGYLKPLLQAHPDAILIRNLGSLLYFQEEAPHLELIGDFTLNVANELTADFYRREGLSRLVPSYDLHWEQFVALVQRTRPEWYEPVVHQHMPMFHMEHCVFAAFLSTGKDWRDCGRPCDTHKVELRDRVGASFPVTPDAGCRNTVFNSVAQSGAEYIGRMKELGLRRFRIELVREKADEIRTLLETYRRVADGTDDGHNTWKRLQAMNQLGVTRGTLQLI